MRTLIALVALLTLTACSLPVFFRVPVVQGNIVTADNVSKLERGMTRRQVAYVMGTPLVKANFEKNRWDYVFYYRDPRAQVRKSEINLYFVNDKLADVEGDEVYTKQVGTNTGSREALKESPLPSAVTPGPNNQDPDDTTTGLNNEEPSGASGRRRGNIPAPPGPMPGRTPGAPPRPRGQPLP